MDINPYRFEAPFTDFEFANFHLKHKTKLIFLICAWKDSDVSTHTCVCVCVYERMYAFLYLRILLYCIVLQCVFRQTEGQYSFV